MASLWQRIFGSNNLKFSQDGETAIYTGKDAKGERVQISTNADQGFERVELFKPGNRSDAPNIETELSFYSSPDPRKAGIEVISGNVSATYKNEADASKLHRLIDKAVHHSDANKYTDLDKIAQTATDMTDKAIASPIPQTVVVSGTTRSGRGH